MRRTSEIFFKGLLTLGLMVGLAACSRPSNDEEAVRAQLESLAEAVEDRSASGIVNHLADDFSGPAGMTKELAEAYARTILSRYSELGVAWTLTSLEIQQDRARVQLNTVLTGKATIPGFEGRGRLMTVDLGLRKTGGEWMVVHAQWRGTLER